MNIVHIRNWAAALFVLTVAAMNLPVSHADQKANTCSATAFPFAKGQKNEDLKKLFERMDRNHLREYFYWSLTNEKAPIPLRNALGKYIRYTELDRDWNGFYGTLNAAAGIEPAGPSKTLALSEICEFHKKLPQPK